MNEVQISLVIRGRHVLHFGPQIADENHIFDPKIVILDLSLNVNKQIRRFFKVRK